MSIVLALVVSALAVDPASLEYEYRGPSGEGTRTGAEIVALVRAAPRAEHLVKGAADNDWRPWNQVPELARLWLESDHGAGGAPPQRPPDVEEGEAGAEPAPVPTATPADAEPDEAPEAPKIAEGGSKASPRAAVRVGGDVRIGFVASNLERLGAAGDPPPAGFVVSRARPIVDVSLGEWLAGRVAVEVRQDDATTTYADTGLSFDVRDWAEGWSIQGREIWLAARAGTTFRHEVRVGLQEPAFGVRETYEDDYPFAGEARADLARRTGLIPEEDLGIGWRGALGDTWAFDVQVLNGSGGTRLDQNAGKDFVARVAASPGDLVTVSASGLLGARGEDASGNQAQGELALEVRGARQRVLIEGIVGATTEDRLDTFFSAAAASGAWDFPVESTALSEVTLVGRVQYYDPVAGWDAPDGWWAYGAGAWAGWQVLPEQRVRTGATWQSYVPQDSALPIEHEVVAEVVWQF